MTLSGFPPPPEVGFTNESMRFPGDQLDTCSQLSLLRNRTKENIKETKDEIQEARRPGAFSECMWQLEPFLFPKD